MQFGLIRLTLRAGILLWIILATIIIIIHVQPYQDQVTDGLVNDNCTVPCFMGIRPGSTSMSQAYYLLSAHDWVANTPDEFPSLLRESSRIGAWIPRTVINWRWSTTQPPWIDGNVQGNVTLENNDVLNMDIQTQFLLGDIILAFGLPDDEGFTVSEGQVGRGFHYIAWFADERLLIRAEGFCSTRPPYHFPVRIIFRAQPPHLPEGTAMSAPCR